MVVEYYGYLVNILNYTRPFPQHMADGACDLNDSNIWLPIRMNSFSDLDLSDE